MCSGAKQSIFINPLLQINPPLLDKQIDSSFLMDSTEFGEELRSCQYL